MRKHVACLPHKGGGVASFQKEYSSGNYILLIFKVMGRFLVEKWVALTETAHRDTLLGLAHV